MKTLSNSWWFARFLFIIFTLRAKGENLWVPTSLGALGGSIEHFIDAETNFETDVKQFLGVPFAKPPLGNLRFQKPEAIEAWSKPLYCRTWPNACVQFTEAPFPWAMSPHNTHKSEDCLYMNIWVPEDAGPENKKSVFFWIHGGGFFIGSIRQEIYDGRVMAAIGDVIVVTTNYRLGSLGFWSNNDTTAPGNVGVWDIITALKWVHDNIESFGGDKDSITIAGESAGSAIVSLLSITPYAQGLYKRVIMQSGSAMWTLMDNKLATFERSFAVAESLGCANESFKMEDHPNEVVTCMRGIDALEIMKEETKLNPWASSTFMPRWGDELFPRNPREVMLEGGFPFDELLIGNSGTEGAFKMTTGNQEIFGFFGGMQTVLTRSESIDLLKKSFNAFEDQDKLIQHYIPAIVDGARDRYQYNFAVANALGDNAIVCPTIYFALMSSHSGAKVYYYDFRHRPDHSEWAGWMGTTHFDEVDFVFGGPFKKSSIYSTEERNLSRMMIQHWSNFVKNGKPNDDWPPYGIYFQTMVYAGANETDIVVGPHICNCKFWRPYFDPENKIQFPGFK